jgi:Mn-dependent DtxR family transcriptional regulator
VRAADLAKHLGRDRKSFKTDVRKLKELGLTESLEVGYRLSPRGRAWLRPRPQVGK